MAKTDIAKVVSGVHALVKDLEADERLRALNAVLTMIGDQAGMSGATASQGGSSASTQGGVTGPLRPAEQTGARAYFDQKDPKTKIEELAVAARYREQYAGAHTHVREDLEALISREARRNFDRRNFNRDVSNAKVAGLFNKAKELSLSYYGQQYVDALPDREAVGKLRRPKVGRSGKSKRKATRSVR